MQTMTRTVIDIDTAKFVTEFYREKDIIREIKRIESAKSTGELDAILHGLVEEFGKGNVHARENFDNQEFIEDYLTELASEPMSYNQPYIGTVVFESKMVSITGVDTTGICLGLIFSLESYENTKETFGMEVWNTNELLEDMHPYDEAYRDKTVMLACETGFDSEKNAVAASVSFMNKILRSGVS